MNENSDVSNKIADIITMVLFDRLDDEVGEGEGEGGESASNVRKQASAKKSKSKKPQKEKSEDEEKEDEEEDGEGDGGKSESDDSGEGDGDGDGEGDGEGEGDEESDEDDQEEEGEEEGDGEGDSGEGEGDGEGEEGEDESEGEDYASGAGGRSVIAGLDYKETILLGGGVISTSSEARRTRLSRINFDDLMHQQYLGEHKQQNVRDKVKITQSIRRIATVFARSTKLPRRTEAAYTPASSGRFNVRKAHRLEMPDNLRVFKARKGIEAPSAEIVILVDASGSTRMDTLQDYGETILQSFTTVAAILYIGLKMIDIPVRIMAYGGGDWQWMDLEGRENTIVPPEVGGGTPTDAAIRQAFEMVLKDSKARVRIVANLTDGAPTRPYAVRSTVEYLAVQGVHTLGCYLGKYAGADEMKAMVQQYGEGKAIVGNNTNIFIAQIAQAMRYVASLK